MDFGFILLLLIINFQLLFHSVRSDGVCISKGGRFPPYALEGKPPGKVSKGPKDLTLCRVFRKKTCCDVAQTHPALISVRRLALKGEASQECVQLWELLECSICDPRVGIQPGPPLICTSLCDRIFEACADAYFSMDAVTQILAPCGTNEIICAKASKWVFNGSELCQAAGFSVSASDNIHSQEETSCYGGKASLDSISDSWKDSSSETAQTDILTEMSWGRKVFWAVGGMVLTAGLLVMSKRKTDSHRQRIASIQRATRRLEARSYQKSGSSRNRKER